MGINMTIQSQVSEYLTNEPTLTKKQLQKLLPNVNSKTLYSCYNRHKKPAVLSANSAERITMDLVENLIIQGKTPIPLLRVMTDFLKVKSQDHSELEEIDMDLFYKKAMDE